jgi:hypothetical protein
MAELSAQIPPETPLPSFPERSVGLSLPLPINARIDLLVLIPLSFVSTSFSPAAPTVLIPAAARATCGVAQLRLPNRLGWQNSVTVCKSAIFRDVDRVLTPTRDSGFGMTPATASGHILVTQPRDLG